MALPEIPYTPELQESEFLMISQLVKQTCGINLHSGKVELVKARLGRRMRELGLQSYSDYLDRLHADVTGEEFVAMLDVLSTNVTEFFREPNHFEYLTRVCVPSILQRIGGSALHLWSAGCSSGEEPYSMAIVLAEALPAASHTSVKILATDLSTRILERARQGLYEKEKLKNVSPLLVEKYFTTGQNNRKPYCQVAPVIRKNVYFSRLNFLDPWPMKGPFEVIFCRNVMIYFDRPTREQLVQRFWDILTPGGTLFIGHSESFSGIQHRFKYIQPTIYQRS
jgi:chemotaxis protein methyltransferase CheR